MKIFRNLTKQNLENAIWQVIDTFCNDWKKQPARWDMEINIQGELYKRLDQLMTLFGCNIINQTDPTFNDGKEKVDWNRVSCEPTVTLKNKNVIRPDIVIYDFDNGWENDKYFFVIEIKYNGRNKTSDYSLDAKKLKTLYKNEKLKYGCVLSFFWSEVEKKDEWNLIKDTPLYLRKIGLNNLN